jgi:hypothetical protein
MIFTSNFPHLWKLTEHRNDWDGGGIRYFFKCVKCGLESETDKLPYYINCPGFPTFE